MTMRVSTNSALQSPSRRIAALAVLAAMVFLAVAVAGSSDELWIVLVAAALAAVVVLVVAKAMLEMMGDTRRYQNQQLVLEGRLSELAAVVAEQGASLAAKRSSFAAQRSTVAAQRAELARLTETIRLMSAALSTQEAAGRANMLLVDERLGVLDHNGRRLTKQLQADGKAHHEARVRLLHRFERDLHVLRKESGGTKTRSLRAESKLAKLSDAFDRLEPRLGGRLKTVDADGASRHKAMMRRIERDRRIHHRALAARDSTGAWPHRLVLQMTINRTGSTRLFDILRTHNDVYMEPLDFVWQELGLSGRRYPVGLSNIADADTSIVSSGPLAVGIRSMRPLRPGMADTATRSVAVEKAHPQFFDFDVGAFVANMELLKSRHDVHVDLVYQIRRPLDIMWSMAEYKERDASWMGALTISEIPSLVRHEFESLMELWISRPGLVVDFDEVMPGHLRMRQLGQLVAPDATSDDIDEWLQEAFSKTDRSSLDSTAFIGNHGDRNEAGPDGAWVDLGQELAESQRIYGLLRDSQK